MVNYKLHCSNNTTWCKTV